MDSTKFCADLKTFQLDVNEGNDHLDNLLDM